MTLKHIRTAGLVGLVVGVTWTALDYWQETKLLKAVVNQSLPIPVSPPPALPQSPGTAKDGTVMFDLYSQSSSSVFNALPILLSLIGLGLVLGANTVKILRQRRAPLDRASH